MAETLGQALAYINELFPNKMNSSTIVTLINNEIRRTWKDLTSTNIDDTLTTLSSQAIYSLPTYCDFDMIAKNGIMVATSTGAVSSTTVFEEYSYCGPDDELDGNKYYEGLTGTFGVYPTPETAGYPIRIKYQERPTLFASSDTSVEFPTAQDHVDEIKMRVMSRIAKSGNKPDIGLANNYEVDADKLERDRRMYQANKRMKEASNKYSYTEGWDY